MRQPGRILVTVVALATTGFAQAQAVDNGFRAGASSLLGTELPGIFSASSVSRPYLPADVRHLTAATDYQTSITGAIKHGLATTAEPTRFLNPPLGPRPGDVSAQLSGSAAAQVEGAFLFSDAAAPEPTEGTTLLCGLLVAAFIAWRKMSG